MKVEPAGTQSVCQHAIMIMLLWLFLTKAHCILFAGSSRTSVSSGAIVSMSANHLRLAACLSVYHVRPVAVLLHGQEPTWPFTLWSRLNCVWCGAACRQASNTGAW